MNQLTTYEPPTVTHVGSEMIAATARALQDAHTIGSALCQTAFVPKHFQGKAEDAAAAILYGSNIGMDPMTALQNIYVIGGKPALYARTMVAIVVSKGHRVWTEEETEGRVTVAGQRKGSDAVERVTWTSDMAKRAGYETNAKYKTDARSMLYARASGDVARRIAPDALLGMAHNVEEMQLEGDDRPVQQPKPRGMDAVRQAVTPDPPPADVTDAEVVEDDQPTEAQRRKMFAAFRDADFGDARTDEGRTARLAYIGSIVGHDVDSSSDLTGDEVSQVIDALAADTEQPEPDDGFMVSEEAQS